MKNIKLQICSLMVLAACVIIPSHAFAQWSVGGSYEIRNDDPKQGFGIQLQRQILNPIPIVDIGLRAHFSYFKDDNRLQPTDGASASDVTYYDYGIDAIGGVPLGLLKPYIGLGIGANTYDIQYINKKSHFFWNSFVGVRLSAIPIIHPYIEYRFTPASSPGFAENFDSNGRLVLGAILSF